jgi:hypothetical protein
LIVSGTQVPGIGRLPQQRRLVGAQRVNAAGLRGGVAVIAGKTESPKPSRQIGQPLLVRDLKARDVGTAGIGWLLNEEAGELTRGGLAPYGNDRVAEVLVEEAGLNQSKRAEKLLKE